MILKRHKTELLRFYFLSGLSAVITEAEFKNRPQY
jgi:hypothetical protein